MYGDKVFASNHHAILSKCYERYLNVTVLTALSAVYHILYPNINQFEQPVSRRHLICSDIEIHQERFSVKSKSQRSAVVMASWYGKVNLHTTTASYIIGIVAVFLEACISYWCFGRTHAAWNILTTCLLTLLDGKSQQYNHVCSCVVSPCPSPA